MKFSSKEGFYPPKSDFLQSLREAHDPQELKKRELAIVRNLAEVARRMDRLTISEYFDWENMLEELKSHLELRYIIPISEYQMMLAIRFISKKVKK